MTECYNVGDHVHLGGSACVRMAEKKQQRTNIIEDKYCFKTFLHFEIITLFENWCLMLGIFRNIQTYRSLDRQILIWMDL